MRRDEKPSCSGEWNLLLCVCFDYVIPERVWVQSVSVRRRPLHFGIYIRIVEGETPKEDSAKPASFLPTRAGDLNRHLVVLRERPESKKEIHVAILSIAKPFFGIA